MVSKMHVGMILNSLLPVASNHIFASIVNDLTGSNIEFEVFYFNDSPTQVELKCSKKKIRYLEKIPFPNYDIIHTHGPRSAAYMAWYKDSFPGKHIMTMHSIIRNELASTYNKLFAMIVSPVWLRLARNSEVIVSLNKGMCSEYAALIKGPWHTFIYNGIPEEIPNDQVDVSDENILRELNTQYKVIGSVARITPIKGLEQAIKFLSIRKDFAYLLIGDGPFLPNLRKMAINCSVSDRCYFLGHKDKGYRYLKFMDVFLMSSYSEGFGLALAEAARAGKSCVCSDIDVFREIFSENEVTYFQPGNILSLESSILHAYNTRDVKGTNIYKKFIECYTEHTMVENYRSLYYSSIAN